MRSVLVAYASSYDISGFGLAIAKTIGWLAIDASIFFDITFATESPRNTSAPATASSRVLIFLSVTKSFLYLFRSVRLLLITPLLSTITTFSFLTPRAQYSFVQEI